MPCGALTRFGELERHASGVAGKVKIMVSNGPAHGDDDFAVGEAMETSRFFRLPVIDLAEAHRGGSGRTFLYELAWSGTKLGACHVLDVPFCFDRLDTDLARALAGEHPSSVVASLMHSCWVAFAADGDPDPARKYG